MRRNNSLLLLFLLSTIALANTEIRNFEAIPELEPAHVAFPTYIKNSPILNATTSERRFEVLPAPLGTSMLHVCDGRNGSARFDGECPYEQWVRLLLDADEKWRGYGKFTVRVSWPAFYPTDFDILLYTPSELSIYLHDYSDFQPIPSSNYSRLQYARIRLLDTGVRNPANKHFNDAPSAVPFHFKVEPLYFGVLPASVLPTILLLVPVIGMAVFVVLPRVERVLEGVAAEVRREVYEKED